MVQDEADWARALGVPSTPSFVINGQPIVGGYPFEVFEQFIDAELSRIEGAESSGE